MKLFVALCSAVVWGSGQVINRQKLKGFVLFLIQCCFLWIELSTGTWNVLSGAAEATFRNCGYFTKGIWGLITLGEIPRADSSVLIYDHSIMLLVGGLISVTILLIFVCIWIWNVKDAYTTREQINRGKTEGSIAYARKLWEKSFEHIMLIPAGLLVLFIVFIPLVFTAILAFTNYNANTIPPKNLIEVTPKS